MHAIKDKPVVVDGQIVIRPIMVVALTYDHRLLDGREAVTFLGECPVLFRSTIVFSLRPRCCWNVWRRGEGKGSAGLADDDDVVRVLPLCQTALCCFFVTGG
jgi:hypothetical protein